MGLSTLVSTNEVAGRLGKADWAFVECRYSLQDPDLGEREYQDAHIPGAVYAHVDRDLSSAVEPGRTGRHPLPDPAAMAGRLGDWGIDSQVQVVAYDDSGGAMAARLWWLCRWLGHDHVAVLDGGWSAWHREGRPVREGVESRPERTFSYVLRPEMVVDAATVEQRRQDPAYKVLDARAADRFRGENETIDPVAGHIPGAISAPFEENLAPDGRFLSIGELRRRFEALLGDVPPERAISYCGSGVTGSHNVLAMAHAGLNGAKLYAGSWSEWITDPRRPVATG